MNLVCTKPNIEICDECLVWSQSGYENPEWWDCPVGCFTRFTHECKINKLKSKKSKDKNFCFLTIQDFTRRMEDLEKLQLFLKRIDYLYDEGHWVIEAGKNKIEYNVHIHLLIKIKNNVKNHKNRLNISWMKLFNTNLYDADYYLLKQWRKSPDMPEYQDWLDEKLTYFDNNLKGDHINTIDLGLKGTFGTTQQN